MNWYLPSANRLAYRPLFAVIPVVVILPLAVGSFRETLGLRSEESQLLTCTVSRGDFTHKISARGELESAINVEVRCEVRSRSNVWTRILEVVPEGTHVQPGDFLIRLDSSSLEADRLQQLIVCERIEAAVIQAQGVLANAQAARQEYLDGEYTLQRQQLELSLFLAKEKDRRARHYLEYSRQLAARDYITPYQLEADAFAVQAAASELDLAQTRLTVLDNFTKRRRLKELDGAVATATTRLTTLERIALLQQGQLTQIEEQIAKCEIRAPVAGQVVLAHLYHDGHSHMVIPGELTMENRVLIRLPDPSRMQVKAMINEDRIAMVRRGSPVTIALEAYPDVELRGTVARVNEYPNPDLWFGPAVKRYETIISLDSPPDSSSVELRPGLTADLGVFVERLHDQLLVPCQAVFKHGEQDYCILADGDTQTAQPVSLGPSNGKFVVICDGLAEGQQLILNAATYRNKVFLPKLPNSSVVRRADSSPLGRES